MPLDARWVDAIHARLLVRYGTRWVNLWAGIPEELVKADWAEQLNGLSGPSIQHAMEHLPAEFPPTVAQFKALAMARVEPAPLSLPAPPANPHRVAEIMAGMQRPQPGHPRAWAYRLRDRERAGDALTQAQRDAWREALGARAHARLDEEAA